VEVGRWLRGWKERTYDDVDDIRRGTIVWYERKFRLDLHEG